jgi:hypothetical protein
VGTQGSQVFSGVGVGVEVGPGVDVGFELELELELEPEVEPEEEVELEPVVSLVACSPLLVPDSGCFSCSSAGTGAFSKGGILPPFCTQRKVSTAKPIKVAEAIIVKIFSLWAIRSKNFFPTPTKSG